MKVFLLLSRYIKPLEDVDGLLPEHRAFLDRHYAAGHFILSGPLEPRTGGAILAVAATRDEVAAILDEDPFVRDGVSEYDIIEVRLTRNIPALNEVLGGSP